jgi:hypothetical protein
LGIEAWSGLDAHAPVGVATTRGVPSLEGAWDRDVVGHPAVLKRATVAAGHLRDTREQNQVATTDHRWQKH